MSVRSRTELAGAAGVPRYVELVSISDDPGEAAANCFALKLMGYPDVKVLIGSLGGAMMPQTFASVPTGLRDRFSLLFRFEPRGPLMSKDIPDFSNVQGGSAVPDFSNVQGGSSSTTEKVYVVVSGDSLSKIAQREYGHANLWNRIYDANRDTLKDPDKIYPGQKLRIPS